MTIKNQIKTGHLFITVIGFIIIIFVIAIFWMNTNCNKQIQELEATIAVLTQMQTKKIIIF
jgi:hypothetical protein